MNPQLTQAQKEQLAGYDPSLKLAGLDAILDGLVSRQFEDPGRCAVNVLRLASDVADAETVTIGSQVYEFDRAANGVTAGRIPVTGHADDTPAAAGPALATAINTNPASDVAAAAIATSNEVLIFSKSAAALATACTETLAGANNAWAAAAMFGGRAAGQRRLSIQKRVPTAAEVAIGNMHFMFDFAPTVLGVVIYVTATPGIALAWGGAAPIVSGNRVTLVNGTDPDWAATHTVLLIVSD